MQRQGKLGTSTLKHLSSNSGTDMLSAPLKDISVLDFSALGPGPFASMMFADFGADVISVRRPGGLAIDPSVTMQRDKLPIEIDISQSSGRELVARLAAGADVVIESFRPGVMERLGLGPIDLMTENPRLIYVRLTGWGQHGANAQRAGHDINYLATSGLLSLCGAGKPLPPLAFLGDIANGSYSAVIGTLIALFTRERTGVGRIVDAAITDAAAYMASIAMGERNLGLWSGKIEEHLLSGEAPFYGTYRCADDRWFAVGAIESKFYDAFLTVIGLPDVSRAVSDQFDVARWRDLKSRVASQFATRSRDEWSEAFAGHDACATPVLDLDEITRDDHLIERGTIQPRQGSFSIAVAPKLSGWQHDASRNMRTDATDLLKSFGLNRSEIDRFISDGTLILRKR